MATVRLLSAILLVACLATIGARAESGVERAGWWVEAGTEVPGYAAVEPTSTNLNIDILVLSCEEAGYDHVLQLQLYLTDSGPFRPMGLSSLPLKDDPRAQLSIDGRVFPVDLLFADDYVVLADAQDGPFPMLSHQLMTAMQTGKTMTLQFDLLAELPGQPPSFDGEAVIELHGGGHQAIAAVRRCANEDQVPIMQEILPECDSRDARRRSTTLFR